MNGTSFHCQFFLFLLFMLLSPWGKTENGSFPYALDARIYEIPSVFTNQFSGIENQTVRKNILCDFYELPFANTGVVERTELENAITLCVPLELRFSPSLGNHPVHRVHIRFTEPSGEFLPVEIPTSDVETQLIARCRDELRLFYNYNTNAFKKYWMGSVQNYGGLAKIPFHAQQDMADESVPMGTNGWGLAFWVDLEDPALLGWEAILPPEEE